MELDRRNFLMTLAVGSAVVAGAGLAGCAPKTKAVACLLYTSDAADD